MASSLRSWYSQLGGRSLLSFTPREEAGTLTVFPEPNNFNSSPASLLLSKRFLLPSEWLFELLGIPGALERSILAVHTICQSYARAFGRQSVHIIAYKRNETQKRDILHVVLCDVMRYPGCQDGVSAHQPRVGARNSQIGRSDQASLKEQASHVLNHGLKQRLPA